ncbi:MAG: hypothetical protein KIT19_02565 [Phycisphaeraceae bacterium]|nr:hypothetical protein [Phycisphaeraceae bacterium]
MGLIRRPDIQQMARDAIVMNLGDIAREGERLAAKAKAEAARIVAEARAERERLLSGASEQGRAEGYQKGFEEGRAAGIEEGRRAASESYTAELARLQQSWEREIQAFEAQREEMLSVLRRDAVSLAVALAERVIRRSVEADESVVLRQIEAALGVLARASRIAVAIHPDDEELVRGALPGLVQRFSEVTHAEIALDRDVPRGGCVVRTESGGMVDATLRSQLDRLASAIGVRVCSAESSLRPVVASEDELAIGQREQGEQGEITGDQSRSAA